MDRSLFNVVATTAGCRTLLFLSSLQKQIYTIYCNGQGRRRAVKLCSSLNFPQLLIIVENAAILNVMLDNKTESFAMFQEL